MIWNYRVIQHKDKKTGKTWLGIHEVYYDDRGRIDGWAKDPVGVRGTDFNDLKQGLNLYYMAIKKPILIESVLERMTHEHETKGPNRVGRLDA